MKILWGSMVGGSDLGFFCEFFVISIIILLNSLGIFREFFGDVWSEGFECLGVDFG